MRAPPGRPRRPLLLPLLLLLAPLPAGAQRARAVFTAAPPRIDGVLDDVAWQAAPAHGGFRERRPRLAAVPEEDTQFRVVFDGEALYIGVFCADRAPEQIRARTVQRDSFAIYADDAITIKIDPQGDRRTTLGFTLNPASGQLDFRGINESDFVVEFDPVWRGEARRVPGGWSAELRIPFASLQIEPGRPPARVGLNVSRDHPRKNATYDWALLPPPLSPVAASRYGELLGLEALPRDQASALRYGLTPYLLLGARHLPQVETLYGAGTDARLQVGERLSVQLSLLTDFAQADLDDQRINLSRFGLFYPEKRDFFLRDLELFSFGRSAEAQALQTRRIGLTTAAQQVPLLDGLKLITRPQPWLRVGLLQAVTLPQGGQPWTLSLVGRAQAELPGGSNVGAMLTHRQSLETRGDHNLLVGVDGAWRSSGPFLASGFAMLSLTGPAAAPVAIAAGGSGGGGGPAPGVGAEVNYRGLLVRPRLAYAYYDPRLRADLGFLRRVGVHQADASLVVEPRFQRRGVERLTLRAEGGVVAGADPAQLLDYRGEGEAALTLMNGFALGAGGWGRYETLLTPFQLDGGTEIAAGAYGMKGGYLWLETPGVWVVSGSAALGYGDFYGGDQGELQLRVEARPLSLLRLEVGAVLTRTEVSADLLHTAALNGRLALGLSPKLGLDAFVAWNNVADLVRLQGRLRYRYADGSDILVVYQQDLSQGGEERFRSLLVKASYQWQR